MASSQKQGMDTVAADKADKSSGTLQKEARAALAGIVDGRTTGAARSIDHDGESIASQSGGGKWT